MKRLYDVIFFLVALGLSACAAGPACKSNALVDPAHCGTALMRREWARVPEVADRDCELAARDAQMHAEPGIQMTGLIWCADPIGNEVKCRCVPTGTRVSQ